LPTDVIRGYYASFDVPPVFDGVDWWTPCNTTVPPFGIKIGGTVFNVSSADIVLPYIADLNESPNSTTDEEYCQIAMVDMSDAE